MIINKAKAALSNFKLFCSENLLKFPLTKIPTNVGKAINKNILTENFKRLRSKSTDGKNKAYIFKNIGIDTNEISVSKSIDLIDDKGSKIGEVRSGVYSPHFKKVIGIAMLDKPYYKISQTFKISINSEVFEGKVCDLPFI